LIRDPLIGESAHPVVEGEKKRRGLVVVGSQDEIRASPVDPLEVAPVICQKRQAVALSRST
jgi:hypothetical protein